jgi:flagellar biosynthesis protein FlhG
VAEILQQDQAEGLRRLLARDFVRVVTVSSGRGGIGKRSLVINLAAALARRGKNVMILDERLGPGVKGNPMGFDPRYDLMDVIRRRKTLEEVIVEGPEGVALVPAAAGLQAVGEMGPDDRKRLAESFEHLPNKVDVVLVDTVPGIGGNVLSLSLASQEVVVVVSGLPNSITDAYALIKVLNKNFARRHFHILVSKAAEEEAASVFNNMSQVAKRFLNVNLDFMGYVPADEMFRKAAIIRKPVVEAFPDAESARALRNLAEVMEQWPYPKRDGGRLDAFVQLLSQSSRMAAEGFPSS